MNSMKIERILNNFFPIALLNRTAVLANQSRELKCIEIRPPRNRGWISMQNPNVNFFHSEFSNYIFAGIFKFSLFFVKNGPLSDFVAFSLNSGSECLRIPVPGRLVPMICSCIQRLVIRCERYILSEYEWELCVYGKKNWWSNRKKTNTQ